MNKDLVNYVVEAHKHGLTTAEIKQNLITEGWEGVEIEEAVKHAFADEHKPATNKDEDLKLEQTSLKNPARTPNAAEIKVSSNLSSQTTVGQTYKAPANTGRNINKILLFILLVFFLSTGAAAYFFGLLDSVIYGSPQKIWNKYKQTPLDSVYSNKFKISYKDNGISSASSTSGLLFNFSNVFLDFDGQYYVDTTDSQNPKSSSVVKYTAGSGNSSFSTSFKYFFLGKVLYFNIGENPIFSALAGIANTEGKTEWLKIDFDELEKEMLTSPKGAKQVNAILNSSLKEELSKIWSDSTFVKLEKSLGNEKIGKQSVLHLKNSLDKQGIKDAFTKYVEKISGAVKDSGEVVKESDVQQIKTAVNALVDKMEVKTMETWVGVKDGRLYKVKFESNFPSLVSLTEVASRTSENDFTNSDAKRLADVRQLASAYELYFNDNQGYPAGENGKPVDISPLYIGIFPTAPKTSGQCTEYFNNYWYTPKGQKLKGLNGKTVYSDYEMTFCLGADTGGYKAGVLKLSSAGIENIVCPGTPEQCVNPDFITDTSMEDNIKKIVSELKFDGVLSIESEYFDFGKTQELTAPENAFDIIESLNLARSKSRDAKRLADARQFASALELYFNDYNKYPDSQDGMPQNFIPNYLGILPESPTPADGTCSEEDNKYIYKKINASKYEFSFCLGAEIGGYSAGKRVLTEAGIQ